MNSGTKDVQGFRGRRRGLRHFAQVHLQARCARGWESNIQAVSTMTHRQTAENKLLFDISTTMTASQLACLWLLQPKPISRDVDGSDQMRRRIGSSTQPTAYAWCP